MRLDKWLKVSGLIPRRTVAREACDAGRVQVNGKIAKPAHEVELGDVVSFDLGRGTTRAKIVAMPLGNVSRERQAQTYERLEGDGADA